MFNKKNDPLVESVKAVMKQNEVHRQAEAALNEELGISSKKALPHEYHAQYDALLEAKLNEKLTPEAKQLVRRAMGPPGSTKPDIKAIMKIAKSNPKNIEEAKIVNALNHALKPTERAKGAVSAGIESVKQKIGDIADKTNKRPKDTRPDMMEEEGSKPRNSREAKLAAMKEPHDMITHADVLKGRGVIAQEESGLKSTMNGTDTPAKGAKPAGKLEEKATEAQKEKIHKVMGEFKRRKLHSGSKKGPTVTSREQAVAIALNQAGLSKKKMNEAEIPSHKELIDAHKSYFEREEMDRSPAEIEKAAKDMHKALSNPDHPDHSDAKKALRQIMAESVIDEIRENLEANLIAIHESGDDELFENYVNSLTEEELEILGLNETSLPEPGFMGRALSNVGLKTPQVRQQNALRAGIESMAGPSQAEKPAPQVNAVTRHFSGSPVRGTVTPSSIGVGGDAAGGAENPEAARVPDNASTMAAGGAENPQATIPAARPAVKPAPVATPKPTAATQQPSRSASSEQPKRQAPAMGSHTPFGAYGGSAGPLSLEESVKPQIKESLESFLRNRFLKG